MSFLNPIRMVTGKKGERSADYRQQYFKKNPGYAGLPIWICAYCGKFLIGRSSVEVDHVNPVSKSGINSTWNLVSACERCNRGKSDSRGLWVVRGYIAKIGTNLFGIGERLHISGLMLLLYALIRLLFNVLVAFRVVLSLVLYPLIKLPFVFRTIVLVLYVLIILFLVTRFTSIDIGGSMFAIFKKY
jgi:hypothetical protein